MSRWSTFLTSEQRWRPGDKFLYFIVIYIQSIEELVQPDDQLYPCDLHLDLLNNCRERSMHSAQRKEGITAQVSMGLKSWTLQVANILGALSRVSSAQSLAAWSILTVMGFLQSTDQCKSICFRRLACMQLLMYYRSGAVKWPGPQMK